MQQWQSKLHKNLSFRKKSKLSLSSGRRVVSGSYILMQKIHLVEMKPPIPLRPPLQKNPSFKTTKNSSISGKEGQSNKSSYFFVPNTSEETGEVR
jgi:hypothetical protein